MKDAYILYMHTRPLNESEVFNMVEHFCMEHELSCKIFTKSCNTFLYIEGQLYEVNLKEETQQGMKIWIIYCLLKSRFDFLQKHILADSKSEAASLG